MDAIGCITRALIRPLWIATCLFAGAAQAQPKADDCPIYRPKVLIDAMNRSSVGIATGSPGGKYVTIGQNLVSLMDDRCSAHPFRVVPILSVGSRGNLDDIVNLRRIDIGLVQSDVLESLPPEERTRLYNQIRYIAPLHREVVHVLAGPAVRTYRDLDRRRVSVDAVGSGTRITARNMFAILGLQPVIDPASADQALNRLIVGDLDAMVFVTGRGAKIFKLDAGQVAAGQLHFVALPHDNRELGRIYLPESLSSADYPALIPSGTVESWAVQAVMAVYGWDRGSERYKPVEEFVDRLFSAVPRLGEAGYRDLWCEMDLGDRVANWRRFEAADVWLASHPGAQTRPCATGVAAGGGGAAPRLPVNGQCEMRFVREMQQTGLAPDLSMVSWRDKYDAWRGKAGC